MMRFLLHGCAGLLACVAGCAIPASRLSPGQLPSAAEIAALAARAGLAPDEIRQAAAIYNLKCARCHKFHDPANYDNAEWKSWMTKMSRKARLNPEQEQLLSRYLGALRESNPGAPKQGDPGP